MRFPTGLVLGFVALAGLATVSCQKASTSAAKTISLTAPAAIPGVWRVVPADGIESVVHPGYGMIGFGAGLDGLWYCRAKAGQLGLTDGAVLMSFANAVVSNQGKTFSFGTYEPLNYGFNPSVNPYNTVNDQTAVDASLYVSYDVVMTSATSGHLLLYTSTGGAAPRVMRDPSKYSFTLDLVEDGHWLRKSATNGKQSPDYDLLRIVAADGTRTANYDLYLNDIQQSKTTSVLVSVPAGSDLATKDFDSNALPAAHAISVLGSNAKIPGSNGLTTVSDLQTVVTDRTATE